MIQTQPKPKPTYIALSLLLLIGLFSSGPAWGKRKKTPAAKSQSARADKKSRAEKKRGKSAKASRTDKKRGASARESRAERVRNRASKRDRSSSRTARRDRNRKADRPLSRRERLAEARRRQRELAEARRRAELARLAAIARQRAADQALRDETAANIARDETTGEDLEVRRIALSALGNHAGTVVVMDPKNGRVYTIVNQEWAVRRGFKPCSTIKLVTGVAGLCEKVIDPVQTVDVSTSSYHLDLTDSLAYSNNGFFQSVGGQVGFDRIIGYAREMGLGERTGINHANEYAGRVPLYKSGYAVNRMCSHGDDFEVTPIQLATLVSAIANGGSLLVPHLPRTPQEDVKFQKQERRRVNVPPDLLRRLVPGMIGAVNYGTGKLAYDPLQTVAGKTGSCIGQGGWVGLFASYAPVADPRLAVVVVTRGSRERGRVAAGVAGFIYRALNQRFGIPANIQIANTPETLVPRPKIDPKAAAVISDEEDDAEAVEAGDAGDAGATDTLTNTQRSKVKSVLMTVPSKQPEATNGPAPSQTPEPSGLERPRRVFKDQP